MSTDSEIIAFQEGRIVELEAQLSHLQNNAAIKHEFEEICEHEICCNITPSGLREWFASNKAQLKAAKKDAERYLKLRRMAVELSLSHQVISQLVTNQGELDAAIAEGEA